MAIPTFVSSGATATAGGVTSTYTSVDVLAPAANILPDDLLIILHSARAGTSVNTLVVPSSFSALSSSGLGTTGAHQLSYLIAGGTEESTPYALDGTFTGASPVHCGRLYQFRNTLKASFTEGAATATATSLTVSSSSVTTAGIDRLALCAITYLNGSAPTGTGVLSGTPAWSDPAGVNRHTTISNQLQTCPLPGTPPNTGVTRAAATMGIATSVLWRTTTFALIGITTASNIPNTYRSERQSIKRASFY